MPMLRSLGFNQRITGGKHDESPAAINAFGSVTPAAASDRTATRKALAHEPAATFRSFIYCSSSGVSISSTMLLFGFDSS